MRLIELNSHSTKPVALLLRRGADPNSCNNHGLSSLHFCIRYLKLDSCLDELILLINAGVDVHAVDYDGESITSYAYQTPVETGWEYRRTINSIGNRGYIWKNPWTTIRSGNRGNIWEEALTACGYDAAAFRQAYLDTGGRIRGKHGRWELDSDWEEASAVSDETSDDSEAEQEGEDFTEFEEERQSYDQGQNSNAEIHSYLEPSTFAQEQLDYQHPENTQFVYPPFQVPLESTEIGQSEPSTTGFVTELSQDEYSQTSLNTTLLPVQPTFAVDAILDPSTWSHTSQNHSEVSQYPMASLPYYEDQQPQLDTVQWSYNSTPHQSGIQLPQPWLQTQDYDMLEEDTNIWRQ
jgi:hypothetical protein